MLLIIIIGAFWGLAFGPVQDKFSDLNRRLSIVENADGHFRDILDQRRTEFVTQFEFKQFEQRLLTVEGRLNVLEATRPTTGELQATARNVSDNINKIEDRIKELEIHHFNLSGDKK